MAYTDLQHFIKHLDEKGQLKITTTEVESKLEIAEMADRIFRKYESVPLFGISRDIKKLVSRGWNEYVIN